MACDTVLTNLQGLLGGYVYTGGIFYHIYKEEFPDVSTVAISWVCALPLTLWFIGSRLPTLPNNYTMYVLIKMILYFASYHFL